MKKKLLYYLKITPLLFFLGLMSISKGTMAQTFVHPGIPFNSADLNQLKVNINTEPWKSAYTAFAADAKSSLSYSMQGPFATVGRASDINNIPWRNDMQAIFNLTFMWVFTGNTAYAQKATDILNAWAVTNTVWSGDETFLDIGDYAEHFVTAADILKSTFPGWTAANTANVNNYFANVIWPEVDVPNPVRGANQGAIQLKAAISIAAFLDDATKWNQAISVLRKDAAGGLANSLSNGEVGDSGRDEGHWYGQIQALVWNAEVAWKQGVDLYAELDNRLLAASELYSKFQIDTTGIKFIPFGGAYAYYTGGFGWPLAARRQSAVYNMIKCAYTTRKGIPAPYTAQLGNLVGENVTSFLFLKSSDNSTATAMSPIQHPETTAATSLTNSDVGSVGLAGSASYNAGTWTVKGAGADIPIPPLTAVDAFNYAFKQIKGDATIITRVTGMQNATADAKTGIMIRESLSAGAKYVGLFLQSSNTVNVTWRGATAWNKTNVSWNNKPGGYQNHPVQGIPYWLKLERSGTRIYAYHSVDGINWTCISTVEIPLANAAYVGLCVTSHNTSAITTSTFTNVAITNTAPPGSPLISSATADTATVGAAFSYTIAGSGTPTSYQAVGLPEGITVNTSTGIISGTATIPGTYLVTISATNSNGAGSALLALKVLNNVAPAAPTALVVTKESDTSINLSWTGSTNATSYTVKRSITAGGPYTAIVSNVTSTSFVDVSPYPGSNYYIVTALAGPLESAVSSEVLLLLPPSVPANVSVHNLNGQIGLSWSVTTGAATYNVKRATNRGGPYMVIASGITTNSYTDGNVTNGAYYYYVVSAEGTTLESKNSDEVLAVPGATLSTWGTTAATGTWTEATNWLSGVVPASPAILTFKNSTTAVLNNNIIGLEISRMTFTPEAESFTMSGNGVTLGNDITNYASKTQIINMPITLNRFVTVNTNAGNITLAGAIAGNGGITKTGSGTVTITGANTYAGNTTINGGGPGGWPPSYALEIGGVGTGAIAAPVSGPLGNGKVILNGGALMNNGTAIVFNDIIIKDSVKSYLYSNAGGLTFAGRLLGSGTVEHDGAHVNGLHMSGDNSNFTGTFISVNRSSNHRIRFDAATTGSAKANWILNNGFSDGQGLAFGNGTIHFGSLSGGGLFRNDGAGGTVPVMSIGALNTNSVFNGTITGSIAVTKVGTGTLAITGGNTYWGATSVTNGTMLVSAPLGAITSPVTVTGGAVFGGSGKSNSAVIIGTGSVPGATLAPGDQTVGTFTTTGSLSFNGPAAIYAVEVNSVANTADKVTAAGVTINNTMLTLTDLGSGTVPLGTVFTIVDNTSSTPITGIFNGLAEGTLVAVNGNTFKISYLGGDGNDITLAAISGSPVPAITSSATESVYIGRAYTYTMSALNSPLSFNATGLPAGLSINSTTGVISGTPTQSGTFSVTLSSTNANGTGTAILALTVLSNVVKGVIVASGDAKNIVEWDIIPDATYNVKRATVFAGPYTQLATVATNKYTDTNVTNGSLFYYVVTSVNANVESTVSTVAVAKPNIGQHDYYTFDEASGTRGIDIWGANHATLAATAIRDAGYANRSLKLDGTATSYSSLPAGIVPTLTDFTIATWVKMDAISSWMRVFDFGTGTTNYMFLTVQAAVVSGKSTVRYAIKNYGSELSVSFNYTFPLNTWTHLAISQSGNTCNLYINGALVATNTALTINPSMLGSTNYNYLGKSMFSADPMLKGSIDEFKIFNKALSAAEIANLKLVDQLISFSPLSPKEIGAADFDPSAIASSALPVTYTSSDTLIAKIVNSKVHIVAVGTVNITAAQAGNSIYLPALQVTQSLTVVKKAQTITFSTIPGKRAGDADFNVVATSSSELPVSFTSSDEHVATITNGVVHILSVGSTNITAIQPGNGIYDSVAVVKPFNVLPFKLKVLYSDGDNGQVTNNMIKPNFQIVNTDSVAASYAQLTARYWFTAENYAGINTYIDYAQLGTGIVKAKYVVLDQPRDNALGYVEYSFDNTTATLNPGANSGIIQTRVANTDWSLLAETNDFSYAGNTAYTDNAKFTLYRNGVLIWGNEPALVTPAINLKAYSENRSAGSHTLSTYIKVDNEGNLPVDYKDISVRYFFTKDGSSNLNYWIDYAKLGNSKISGQFAGLNPSESDADTRFEVKVDSTVGKLYPLSSTGNIQYRIAKSDWSAFNQLNDYSYKAGSFSENDHICVYYKGQLIYGTEPGTAQLATLAVKSENLKETSNPTVKIVTYPNPVTDGRFTIRTSANIPNGPLKLRLTNYYGKIAYDKSVEKSSENVDVQLDTKVPAGLYILQLNNQYTVKIIIQ